MKWVLSTDIPLGALNCLDFWCGTFKIKTSLCNQGLMQSSSLTTGDLLFN